MAFRFNDHGYALKNGTLPPPGVVPNEIPMPDMGEPPVVPVHKPVSELTVGLLVSLGAHTADQPSLGRTNDLTYRTINRSVPSADITFDHVSPARYWADMDLNVAFPRDRMVELEAEGVIGALAPTAVSMLGSISLFEELVTETAPKVKAEFDAQGVDLVLVVPFCPQCHQAMMMLARGIEARGMPTLMMSTFIDIAEAYKPPRAAVVDYPVGSPCGRTNDPEHQRQTLRTALQSVPLDVESRQLVELDLPYQLDGGRDWIEKTLENYRARFDVVIENAVAHEPSESIVGKEEEFAIRCDC